MNNFLKTILAITLAVQTAGAGEKEDEIKHQAQKTAAEEAAKSLTKRAIDKILMDEAMYDAAYAASSQTTGIVTIGSTVIAVYNIGKNATDFHRANNDQQRFFAIANAAASVATMAFPPVGLVMQLALLGQGLLESGYAKRLGGIYERTLEYQKRTLELRNELLQAQWQEYAFVFSRAVASAQLAESYIQFLLTSCQSPEMATQAQQLEECLSASIMAVAEMQISVNMSKRLLSLPAKDFKFFDFLKSIGLTTAQYLQRLKSLQSHVDDMRQANQDLQRQYSHFIANLYVQEAVTQGKSEMANYYGWSCETLAQNVAQASVVFRIEMKSRNLNSSQLLLAIDGLHIALEDFLAEECESKIQYEKQDVNPFEIIRSEIAVLKNMKENL